MDAQFDMDDFVRIVVSENQIRRRLDVARKEVAEYEQYEYVIINDEVEAAVERLRAIVMAERTRVKLMRPVAETITGTFQQPS